MAFIFTNLPAMSGRRAGLEAYLQQLDTASQEQMATDAGITFTPATDIDVATVENYQFLAVAADASTYVDYTGVAADIRDRFEEARIAKMLPEDKWRVAQATTLTPKDGPVFAISTELLYLMLMISAYPGWAKFVYDGSITDRHTDLEDFAMQLSGSAKSRIAAAIPTASYAGDVVTGLFTIANNTEYAGLTTEIATLIKKKK